MEDPQPFDAPDTDDPAEQGHRGDKDYPPNVDRETPRRRTEDEDGDELVGSQR